MSLEFLKLTQMLAYGVARGRIFSSTHTILSRCFCRPELNFPIRVRFSPLWAILGHMAAMPDVWAIVINCQLLTHVTNALALGVVHVY